MKKSNIHISKKTAGVLIISTVVLIFLYAIGSLYIENNELTSQINYIKENGDPVLKENIEVLNEENISLKAQLESKADLMASRAVIVAETFLEDYWTNSNTQYTTILERVKPYSSDDVMEYLGYNYEAEGETIDKTSYGDTEYRSGIEDTSSFYVPISESEALVLCDTEIFFSIDGNRNTTNYLYEFKLELVNDTWMISEIVRDKPYILVG